MDERAVAGCPAQIEAKVVSHWELDHTHWLVRAQMERAFVHPKYWNGKHFLPGEDVVGCCPEYCSDVSM